MNKPGKERLIIVDPSLTDERGHHYALTRAITLGALEFGIDVIWLANRNIHFLPGLEGVQVHPIFSTSTYDPFKKQAKANAKTLAGSHLISRMPKFMQPALRKLRDSMAGWTWLPNSIRKSLGLTLPVIEEVKSLAAEIEHGLDLVNAGPADHVLVHTSEGDIYRAILDLATRGRIKDSSPVFHLNTPYDSEIMPHNKKGLSAQRSVGFLKLLDALDRKVFLYAENQPLAEHLSDEWEADVQPLEIPPPTETRDYVENREDSVNIVYLGAAREEKGFHKLPDIVQRVDSDSRPESLKARFFLQCSPQIVGYAPGIESAIDKLKQFSSERVTLIDKQQSMDDYFAMLRSADVVLLCYDPAKYRVRGSGIAVEAVCFGKIVIATPDTFPASLAGEAAMLASNSREIAEAIIKIAGDKKAYLDKALVRRNEYFDQNSAQHYVKVLMERAKAESERTIAKPAIKAKIIATARAEGYIPEIHERLEDLLQGDPMDKKAKLPKLI